MGREVLEFPFHRPQKNWALRSLPIRSKRDWLAAGCRLGKLRQGEQGEAAAARGRAGPRARARPCSIPVPRQDEPPAPTTLLLPCWEGPIATSAASLRHRRSRARGIQQSTDTPGCAGTCKEDHRSFPLLLLLFPLQYAPWMSAELAEALRWVR